MKITFTEADLNDFIFLTIVSKEMLFKLSAIENNKYVIEFDYYKLKELDLKFDAFYFLISRLQADTFDLGFKKGYNMAINKVSKSVQSIYKRR